MKALDALATTAPRSVFGAIAAHGSKRQARERHDDAVDRVARAICAHLASVALSEYRASDHDPIPEVEELLGRRSNSRTLNFSDYETILRFASRAGSGNLVNLARTKLAGPAKLKAAMEVLSTLGRPDSIAAPVQAGLRNHNAKINGLEAIRSFADYRNAAVVHSLERQWPVDARDYYLVMEAIVEDAVDEFAAAVTDGAALFMVGELENVVLSEDGGHQHLLRVDRGGRARAESVDMGQPAYQLWVSPEWRARRGGLLLLNAEDMTVIGPYVDLLTQSPPPPLPLEDDVAAEDDAPAFVGASPVAEASVDPTKTRRGYAEFQHELAEMAATRGLLLRPNAKSQGAKITPPKSNAYLIYVSPSDEDGCASVSFGYRTWANHFAVTPGEAIARLGPDRSVEFSSGVPELAVVIDDVLARNDQARAEAGVETYLDHAMRHAGAPTAEVLKRFRQWAAGHSYFERNTASAFAWGPTPRRSIAFLYPGSDGTVTLDLESLQKHGGRENAQALLDAIRGEWGLADATWRLQLFEVGAVLNRWPDFETDLLDSLAVLEPSVAQVGEEEAPS